MFSKIMGHQSKHVSPIGKYAKIMGQTFKTLSATMKHPIKSIS